MKKNVNNKFRKAMTFVCNTAWMLVKQYGFTLSEGMKRAWQILKLKRAFKQGVVKFAYMKKDCSIRMAWGTLRDDLVAPLVGIGIKPNKTLCTYFDTEKQDYRSFKIANFREVYTE